MWTSNVLRRVTGRIVGKCICIGVRQGQLASYSSVGASVETLPLGGREPEVEVGGMEPQAREVEVGRGSRLGSGASSSSVAAPPEQKLNTRHVQ
jgi:hypothetical protein